jgi:hypothetical protein
VESTFLEDARAAGESTMSEDTDQLNAQAERIQEAIEKILPGETVYFCFVARSDGMCTTLSNIEQEECERFLTICAKHLREQTSQVD